MVNVFPVKILFKKIQSRNVLKWIEHILALQGDKWGGKLSKKSKTSTENTLKNEGMYPHAYVHVCMHFKLFWLYWVSVAACGLSLAVMYRGCPLILYVGFSLRWLLLLWSTGSRHSGFSRCNTQAQ
ncbi:unnamed protein product [Rangifer tarandus platyrhynchus]|uniref:Uncharacterized protein n=1 Tax=Rangifer tarandus platyrhynchus TaxID=3082113 RepID=A0AC59YV26_RANTA